MKLLLPAILALTSALLLTGCHDDGYYGHSHYRRTSVHYDSHPDYYYGRDYRYSGRRYYSGGATYYGQPTYHGRSSYHGRVYGPPRPHVNVRF